MRRRASTVAERAGRVRFERLVQQALRSLPDDIGKRLDNVDIVVELEPSAHQIAEHGGTVDELFGLYEGTPLAERSSGYTMTLPDKITIFRGPLERAFTNPREIAEEVRITVLHELAHHLGFEEDEIESLGLA